MSFPLLIVWCNDIKIIDKEECRYQFAEDFITRMRSRPTSCQNKNYSKFTNKNNYSIENMNKTSILNLLNNNSFIPIKKSSSKAQRLTKPLKKHNKSECKLLSTSEINIEKSTEVFIVCSEEQIANEKLSLLKQDLHKERTINGELWTLNRKTKAQLDEKVKELEMVERRLEKENSLSKAVVTSLQKQTLELNRIKQFNSNLNKEIAKTIEDINNINEEIKIVEAISNSYQAVLKQILNKPQNKRIISELMKQLHLIPH